MFFVGNWQFYNSKLEKFSGEIARLQKSKRCFPHPDCGNDQRLVRETLHDLAVALGVVPGEVDSAALGPSANLHQTVLLELNDLEPEWKFPNK